MEGAGSWLVEFSIEVENCLFSGRLSSDDAPLRQEFDQGLFRMTAAESAASIVFKNARSVEAVVPSNNFR